MLMGTMHKFGSAEGVRDWEAMKQEQVVDMSWLRVTRRPLDWRHALGG